VLEVGVIPRGVNSGAAQLSLNGAASMADKYVRDGVTAALHAAMSEPGFINYLKRPGMLSNFIKDYPPVLVTKVDASNVQLHLRFETSKPVIINIKVSVPV
jgi:hypothetical protein